jgi:hypothetical protein
MKTFYLTGLLVIIVLATFGQAAKPIFVASVSGEDRIALAKTTIHLTEWHEKAFWNQYENYLNKSQELSGSTYGAIVGMATTDKSVNDKVAFDNARMMIYYRYEQLALWQKYYAEIGSANNGVIALQFLQTEVLLDMLESARIYEQTPLKYFHFHPNEDSATLSVDKHNTLTTALSLSKTEAEAFFKVYSRYEHECADLLGEDYSLIAAYAGDPSDYTPGQAKFLGFNLLEVMRRELKLKEKYFTEMNTAVGSSLAAGFLAWEDYYSLVSKMDAWADAP